MPRSAPKFSEFGDWASRGMVAVGAPHPDHLADPGDSTVLGENWDGYTEAALTSPPADKDVVKTLQLSRAAEMAFHLRQSLTNRPNRLSRRGGPFDQGETLWVLFGKEEFFYKPYAAEVGGEPVTQAVMNAIWASLNQ